MYTGKYNPGNSTQYQGNKEIRILFIQLYLSFLSNIGVFKIPGSEKGHNWFKRIDENSSVQKYVRIR